MPERLEFPPNHVEVDNRLLHYALPLMQRYPDATYAYVHRDPDAVIASYGERWGLTVSAPRAYTTGIRMLPLRQLDRASAIADYVRWCDSVASAMERSGAVQVFVRVDYRDLSSFASSLAAELGHPHPWSVEASMQERRNANHGRRPSAVARSGRHKLEGLIGLLRDV